MDIENIIAKYSLRARAEGLSPKTIKNTASSVRYFTHFIGGIEDVKKITSDDLRRFIISLQHKKRWSGRLGVKVQNNISGTSINTYVRAIRAFWSWMHRENIIKVNPFATVPAPKIPQKLPKVLSEQDLGSIFKLEMTTRDRAILMLLLDSGIRLTELANLTRDDLNKTADGITVTGKGNKQRHVYISDDTGVELTMYNIFERPEPGVSTDKFFLTNDGYPLTAPRIQKILELIGKKAGITQRLSPHKLRHSYATMSLRHGANLEILRRSLGHTDIKTTEVYLSLTDADVQTAHKQFSPISNLRIRRQSNKK